MLNVGNAFLIPTPDYETKHLYILIAKEKSSTKALMVNVTSYKPGCDCSCILSPGDHRFITHRSIINYGDAIITDVSKIEEGIRTKLIEMLDPVSTEVLKRIQGGALASLAIPFKCREFLRKNP